MSESKGKSGFLLYGANGYTGSAIARLAVERGLRPVLAGRNGTKVGVLAAELGLEHRAFPLDDTAAIEDALRGVVAVLHCAGPYRFTFKPILDACLRTGTHYLDLTGELLVLQAIADCDTEAKARGITLLPAVGFDVVPTDCLALALKQRLPSATRLALAFQSSGPAGIPPGTANTMVQVIADGTVVRRNSKVVPASGGSSTRMIDFGQGPIKATRFTWGDVFTAFYTTGISDIEEYTVLPSAVSSLYALAGSMAPLFRSSLVKKVLRQAVQAQVGATAEQRAATSVTVWGEVADDQGNRATGRLRGPEAGLVWTSLTALGAIQKVLAGNVPPGFQTPALAYGANFVTECGGVTFQELN